MIQTVFGFNKVFVDKWIGEYQLGKSKATDISVINKMIEIKYSRIAMKQVG